MSLEIEIFQQNSIVRKLGATVQSVRGTSYYVSLKDFPIYKLYISKEKTLAEL